MPEPQQRTVSPSPAGANGENSRQQDSPPRPGATLALHTLMVAVVGFFIGPIAASVPAIPEEAALALPAALLAGLGFGWLCARREYLPHGWGGRYLFPLCFVWLLYFGFIPFIFVSAFSSKLSLSIIRFVPHFYITGFIMGFTITEQRRSDRVRFPLFAKLLVFCAALAPLALVGCGIYKDATYAQRRGHGFERVGGFSSTDLRRFDPRMPGSTVPRPDGTATFTVRGTDLLPVLDGAEAAFPVYAAFAAACYPDMPPLSEEQIKRYDYTRHDKGALTFTNTVFAFRRLVDGKADIFFGAHPSTEQMALAREKGKELVLTPIGKEAFVFFVNEANPVDTLSTNQVRDIYSGKTRNWKQLGGADMPITAFQRPRLSGSQTIMFRFMGDTPLQEPLRDQNVGPMGGVVRRVSEYRNAPSAIGYSFRFFLTGMGPAPKIKMVALDGVPPTADTIRSGSYPYVVNLYAVTVKDNPNPNITPFLAWMQGPQGQEVIEKTGYVSIR